MASGSRLSHFRSLFRELRSLEGPGALACIPAPALRTLTGNRAGPGDDEIFQNSVLYNPIHFGATARLSASQDLTLRARHTLDTFRSQVRLYLRIVGANRIDDAAVAAAIVDVTCAASRMPFPRLTHSEQCHSEETKAVSGPLMDMDPGSSHLILKPDEVRSGDLVVVHPYLTKEGTGGCVGVVLRHSPLDTLILVVNVDAGIDLEAPWIEQVEHQKRFRPVWRLHAYLPPIALEDPRQFLPSALRTIPLSWGGRYPTPLHLLHSVPLDIPAAAQRETFQRVSGHQILPGLWCSFADCKVVEAAAQKLDTGEALPENFGGFIGMECLQPGKLGEYMRMNHWFVIRPGGVMLPPQGWRCASPVAAKWNDRNWAPWRAAMTSVGGEFRDWAEVDWAAVAGH